MRPKKMKLLAGILAVMLCMTAFSVTAFASGDDWCEYGDYGTPEASESALKDYVNPDTAEYAEMVDRIGKKLNFTTLRYHRLDDMIASVGDRKSTRLNSSHQD